MEEEEREKGRTRKVEIETDPESRRYEARTWSGAWLSPDPTKKLASP